jgi:potassium voltage-gated channel Eag-related subfamily H protein 8
MLIINTCFTTGIFPTACKISRITALYKNGNRNCAAYYRPVNILSIFSKLIERHVNTKSIEHLTENKLLSNFEFGFRKNHSTIDEHKVYQAFNSKMKCVLFSLDLCKAFQTVNILLFFQ